MDRRTVGAAAMLAVALQAYALRELAIAGETKALTNSFAAVDAGDPRRWQVATHDRLRLHAAPDVDATVIKTLRNGDVLTNFGCKRVRNQNWCRVRPLRSRVRGYVTAESLRPARGPDGIVAMGVDTTAWRARRGRFDATGTLRCAQLRGQPLSKCSFGVARSKGGDATVVVTFANGFKRTLYFAHGMFIRADTTMSGVGYDTDWQVEGNMHIIRVDDQRYELLGRDIFGN